MPDIQETRQLLLEHVEDELREYWPKCHKSDDYVFKYDREVFEAIYKKFYNQLKEDNSSVFSQYLDVVSKFELLWEDRYKHCMWLLKKEQQIETKVASYPQDQLDKYLFGSRYHQFFYPGSRADKHLKQLAFFVSSNAKSRSAVYRKNTHQETLNKEEYIAIIKQACQFLSRFLCVASTFASNLAENDVAMTKEHNKLKKKPQFVIRKFNATRERYYLRGEN